MGVGSAITGADLNKALSNDNANISLNTFNAQAGDSMNRYNADVNRQKANYDMAMNEYKSQPPSFGEMAMGVAGTVGGAMLTAHPGSMAGRLGKKFI